MTVVAACALPAVALAGPPFLTDDPEPTETGHWEIYAPLVDLEGRGADFEGTTGAEINYGAARDLQLSAALPLAFAHDAAGWRSGAGDIKLSVKYRFFHDEDRGIQVAAFPAITLPTASNDMGAGRVTGLLPIWLQKDVGPWSVFGGGGYAINPGPGKRDYWTGGLAATNQLSERLLLGIEADRHGADTVGGSGSTSLGVGAIYDLKPPLRLLASGGPTFDDVGGTARFHAFVALGLDF
jgi:hypothetical protein